MPLDALFLGALTRELSSALVGARIDKIHQPERDEIVLALRTASGNRRLLLSAAVGSARAQMLEEARENPATPPNFCMLLRKHIGGGRIAEVAQVPNERILRFEIDATDEFLEPVRRSIIMELIGSQPNIILIDSDNRILDSVRRIEGDLVLGKRQILPGLFYELPQSQQKLSIFDSISCINDVPEDAEIERYLVRTFAGISPPVAREVAFRATSDHTSCFGEARQRVMEELSGIAAALGSGEAKPTLTLVDDVAKDFSYLQLSHYGNTSKYIEYPTYSQLLQAYYETRDKGERLRRHGRELTKLVSNAAERLERKLAAQRNELIEAQNRELLRRTGDILMANLHAIPRGTESIELVDFYNEDASKLVIMLDVRLNPQQNAAKYYKEYARRKTAEKYLATLINSGEDELYYLKSVKNELAQAASDRELETIRDELVEAGYLKRRSEKRKRDAGLPPFEYRTAGGFIILAGRNNLQNDRLTFNDAAKNDIWLHTQGSHGSHVIIRTEGAEPDDDTYTLAGMIAARHSENRGAARVAVDYTRVRHVKKPPGSKPGMVIYDPYFTMYVEADDAQLDAIMVKP